MSGSMLSLLLGYPARAALGALQFRATSRQNPLTATTATCERVYLMLHLGREIHNYRYLARPSLPISNIIHWALLIAETMSCAEIL